MPHTIILTFLGENVDGWSSTARNLWYLEVFVSHKSITTDELIASISEAYLYSNFYPQQ